MGSRSSSHGYGLSDRLAQKEQTQIKESIFELKEIHDLLKYEWPQCLRDNANPIELAVSLLDDTSVGLAHKLPEFQDISEKTQSSLRHVVSEHYEIFNDSIGSYHSLLSTLADTQEDANQIRTLLESTTKDIHDRSDTLNELSQTSARYSEMIEILDAISELSAIPDQIDQLILDKKIHEVYDVIAGGYSVAEKFNLWSLGAMNGIHNYLEMQSNNLFDMIIDELKNEIYLRNVMMSEQIGQNQAFFWESLFNSKNPQLSSFKTLITESNRLEKYIYNSANLDISEIADCFTETVKNFINDQLPKVHEHYSKSSGTAHYSILLDAASNEVSKSFHYIYMLLHTASKLNRLSQAVEILTTSCQQEVHGLISKITEEIKLKNVHQLSKLNKLHNFDSRNSNLVNFGTFNDISVTLLQQLFCHIFIKSLAVLQRHKVVSEIVDKIEQGQTLSGSHNSAKYSRTDGSKSYSFNSIWNLYKKELTTLMTNYIYDNSQNIAALNDNIAHLQNNKGLSDVLKRKDIYKFEDVSYHSTAPKSRDLQNILQKMFPGFSLSDNKLNNDIIDFVSPYIVNESYNAVVEVLVPKSIFNMRIILDFFLIFVAGSQLLFVDFMDVSQTSAPYNKMGIQFFEQFMKFSFLANLKETLQASFKEYVGGKYVHNRVGGFKTELTSLESNLSNENSLSVNTSNTGASMIYQNALDFKSLLINICSNLNASLTYRSDFSDLILNLIKDFGDAYFDFYTELFSFSENRTSLPDLTSPITNRTSSQLTVWMQVPALVELSESILHSKIILHEEPSDLVEKEIQTLLFENDLSSSILDLSKDDFLDNDTFDHVCNLFLTTSSVLAWLPLLRKESNYNIYEKDQDGITITAIEKLKYEWGFLENGRTEVIATPNSNMDELNIYLALNSEKLIQFDQIVKSFQVIRNKTLLALRYDLRCKAIYYIGKSFKLDEWLPATEPSDSDQFIGQLSKEIFSTNSKLNSLLKENEKDGVFIGLAEFIDKILVSGSELVRKINNNGVKKIMLNIFTIQRMLRNVLSNPENVDFSRSSVYFNLFTVNEYTFLKEIKPNEFNFTSKELANMARLIYSEKLADGNGTSFSKTKYNEFLKKIDEACS